ncbi:BDM_1a_G0025930.mRNA.1.CDS.1 [Saccharomyces cerevisiae]|nr:BDM_1a_G0025930.mRNA.1.CDS.1 [Saccharomyces cerevisiae]CAI7167538.1 BDM_1a_G0025930.mRNA.1.CDS.1 [Saccharomyces cerevisiae]
MSITKNQHSVVLKEVAEEFTAGPFPNTKELANFNEHLQDISVRDEEKEFIPTNIKEVPEENDENVDDAFDVSLAARGLVVTEEINKNLLRKIDLYLQPIIWALYTLQYMDKVTNNYAGVMGIQKDLGLAANEFSWLGTAFYLAYLGGEFPLSRLLQKLPYVKTLSACIVIWGIVLCTHSAVKNGAGIIVARVFLGIFESSITPGFVILTSQWYRREEHFARIAYWFSCNGLGAIIGGSIAYGLAHHAESYSLKSWKILFIITGLLSIFFGVLFYFYVPENPSKAWFLSEEERLYQVQRIRSNQQGFGSKKFKKYQLIEVFKDVRLYIYIIWGLTAQIPNGGLGSFGSILLHETLGYSSEKALLMGLPQGAVQIASGIIAGYIATKTGKRILVGVGCCSITLIGTCLLAFTKPAHSRLAGYYIFAFYAIGMVTILASITSDAAGHTKKVTTSALFLISYCIGNVIGPQTFRASDAPEYQPARVTMAACIAIATADLFLLFLVNLAENKRRDRKFKEDPEWYVAPENAEFLDLTDFENKNFRYSY